MTTNDLSGEQRDLLRAVYEVQGDDETHSPSTEKVGHQLHQILKQRGGPYAWMAYAPWHGCDERLVRDLEDRGMVEVDTGVAAYHRPDEPAPRTREYFLSLTPRGREAARSDAMKD